MGSDPRVVLLDADLQHPPALIEPMLQSWAAGADMVCAVHQERADESWLKRVGTRWFYRVVNAGSHVPIPAEGSDFRLLDRCVVDALVGLPERNRFMKGLYAWVGFKTEFMKYVPDARAELRLQLLAYETATGREPDHLDGHQHVHHLPGIRGLLAEVLARRPSLRVRCTGSVLGPGAAFKRWVFASTGGRALTHQLLAKSQAQNLRLLGFYDFVQADYRALMVAWLAAMPPNGALLFCHPGQSADAGGDDPIAAARVRELAYLQGDFFTADLQAAGVELA